MFGGPTALQVLKGPYLCHWCCIWILLQIELQKYFTTKKKVKQSHYRPGVAQRVPGS